MIHNKTLSRKLSCAMIMSSLILWPLHACNNWKCGLEMWSWINCCYHVTHRIRFQEEDYPNFDNGYKSFLLVFQVQLSQSLYLLIIIICMEQIATISTKSTAIQYIRLSNLHNIILYSYSGTPLNGHPWTTAICYITAKSSGPDWTYIDFHSNQTPEERPPRYSV